MNYFEEIQKIVCEEETVSAAILQSKSRKREIVFARQLVMFLLKEIKTKDTWASLAAHYGKDHATAYHAIKVIKQLMESEERLIHKPITEKIADYKKKIKARENFIAILLSKNIEDIKAILIDDIAAGRPVEILSIEVYNSYLIFLKNRAEGLKDSPIVEPVASPDNPVIEPVIENETK